MIPKLTKDPLAGAIATSALATAGTATAADMVIPIDGESSAIIADTAAEEGVPTIAWCAVRETLPCGSAMPEHHDLAVTRRMPGTPCTIRFEGVSA